MIFDGDLDMTVHLDHTHQVRSQDHRLEFKVTGGNIAKMMGV